jgi:hypothetical protein
MRRDTEESDKRRWGKYLASQIAIATAVVSVCIVGYGLTARASSDPLIGWLAFWGLMTVIGIGAIGYLSARGASSAPFWVGAGVSLYAAALYSGLLFVAAPAVTTGSRDGADLGLELGIGGFLILAGVTGAAIAVTNKRS